jgi:RimJ/RimL family protein N-acetyltransferase
MKHASEGEDNYNFIIELLPPATPATADDKHTAIIIGSIGIFGTSELGYLFHPGFWNRGYATEAVAAFIAAVWEGLPHIPKVTGHVDIANAGSMRVLRKCGFKEIKRGPYENVTLGRRVEAIFEIVRPV